MWTHSEAVLGPQQPLWRQTTLGGLGKARRSPRPQAALRCHWLPEKLYNDW